jgi:hypothetical protein
MLANITSSVFKTALAIGFICQIAQGMDPDSSTNHSNIIRRFDSHLATSADFNHDSWKITCIDLGNVAYPGNNLAPIELLIKLIPSNLSSRMPELKPTCSILMNNGAQIDYIPGIAALWILRDYEMVNKVTAIVTGNFNGRDLYSYSAHEFANILMNVRFIYASCPVHVTFSDTGEFPLKHPTEVRTRVIQKWFNS